MPEARAVTEAVAALAALRRWLLAGPFQGVTPWAVRQMCRKAERQMEALFQGLELTGCDTRLAPFRLYYSFWAGLQRPGVERLPGRVGMQQWSTVGVAGATAGAVIAGNGRGRSEWQGVTPCEPIG